MNTSLIQLIVAALLTLGAAGAYAGGYWLVEHARAEAVTLAGQIAEKEAQSARSSSARTALAELSDKEAFVAAHLVATTDIVSFLERLEAAGKEFGATVSVASVQDSSAKDGTIVLSLSIEGSFDAVMRTLGAIEHGPFANAAKSVTLNSDGLGWRAVGSFVMGTLTPTP